MHVRCLTPAILAAGFLGLAGCESPGPGADAPAGTTGGESYEVTAESTPFYRLGPQQATGPDLSLAKGRPVTLVRRSYGFSNVRLDNGWDGWVANEDIAVTSKPVNPPPPSPEMESAIVQRFRAPRDGQPPATTEPATTLPDAGALFEPGELNLRPSVTDQTTKPLDLPEFRY